jgi:hypothetical protein
MAMRNITGILVVLAIVLAFVFLPPRFRTLRESRQIKNEIDWIQNSVLRIQNSPAPPPELVLSASTGRWEVATTTANYLIFSNGWGVYKTHSWHADDGMGDMAVLKMPDSSFYLSRYHFEAGIQADTHTRHDSKLENNNATQTSFDYGEPTKPSDAKDFLENGARWQGWYQFSQDGKLQCIVRSPYEDHRRERKGLWVWIGIAEGTSCKTLFQKKYSISAARDMFWTANWKSHDEIIIDVFDYAGNSPKMMGVDYQKRWLSTLIFGRDKPSSLFLENTNISRPVRTSE